MGLVGSGTNNARLAGLLRNLAQFYHKEPLDLFMVRLAQVEKKCVCVCVSVREYSMITLCPCRAKVLNALCPVCEPSFLTADCN